MSSGIQPHIRLAPDSVCEFALLPGDPERVSTVAHYLENVKELSYNREFKSISGTYKGVNVLVVSTGIGGPSTAIAVEELRNLEVKTLIRIGSCGALQNNIKLGDLVIASGAIRSEGTSNTYIEKSYPAVPDTDILMSLIKCAQELNYVYHCGIIRSHDSFYTDNEEEIDKFWAEKNVLASDMESAALMVIGSLRGLKNASILNVVVETKGNLEEGINNYVDGELEALKGEEKEILTALETVAKLSKSNK